VRSLERENSRLKSLSIGWVTLFRVEKSSSDALKRLSSVHTPMHSMFAAKAVWRALKTEKEGRRTCLTVRKPLIKALKVRAFL
jgi:hypothetical protein